MPRDVLSGLCHGDLTQHTQLCFRLPAKFVDPGVANLVITKVG